MSYEIHNMDCIAAMRSMPDNSVDSIVTDPPYELGFMGKAWDASGIANSVEMWREALRVLKPGGHLLAFSGSRTYHRMTCAIEDAGFDVRDQIMWVYGSGFPKSMDVSKAIDKAAGAVRDVLGTADPRGAFDGRERSSSAINTNWRSAEGRTDARDLSMKEITAPATDDARQWEGWGTALKPAHEPICVARKPLIGTVAANVLAHGTGALNIDGCRVASGQDHADKCASVVGLSSNRNGTAYGEWTGTREDSYSPAGRWPANIIHDGSAEVLALFPESKDGVAVQRNRDGEVHNEIYGKYKKPPAEDQGYGGSGSNARFFYCAKTSKADRGANTHPTVKPTDLMAYLVRLVTPPGGLVLDPFMGSGSTGKACMREGFRFIGCELSAEYVSIAEARIIHELSGGLL